MKISRWIYLPLYFGISWAVIYFLVGFIKSCEGFVLFFIIGSGFGFVLQIWSHVRAKKISGGKDTEEIHQVRQNRKFTLLLSYEKSFELCREAVQSLDAAKIKKTDF